MKTIALAALLFCCTAWSADVDDWQNDPPREYVGVEHPLIESTEIFEVVASRHSVAVGELQKSAFVPISEAVARAYTGHYYTCPKGKQPYLIRALVGYAGSGRFRLHKVGTEVWILHASLGDEFTLSRTALIVNLDFIPSRAFVSVSIVR